jgi:hypothetical protein
MKRVKTYFLLLIVTGINPIFAMHQYSYNGSNLSQHNAQQARQCVICFDNVSTANFRQIPNCNHSCCIDCLNNLLAVGRGDISTLKCPQQGCRRDLTIKDLSTLNNLPGVNQDHIQNIIRILQSNTQSVNIEKQKSSLWSWFFPNEIQKAEAWIKKNTKACPGCKSSIEKSDGCNHIACKKCKHEFCWLCLGQWGVAPCSSYICSKQQDKNIRILLYITITGLISRLIVHNLYKIYKKYKQRK